MSRLGGLGRLTGALGRGTLRAVGDSTPGAEADVLTLENTTDAILLETGDFLLAEGSADIAITAMTAASSLADADVIVGVQGGVTESFALSDLKAYING